MMKATDRKISQLRLVMIYLAQEGIKEFPEDVRVLADAKSLDDLTEQEAETIIQSCYRKLRQHLGLPEPPPDPQLPLAV
jgi:hypothetical protein